MFHASVDVYLNQKFEYFGMEYDGIGALFGGRTSMGEHKMHGYPDKLLILQKSNNDEQTHFF